MEKSRVYFTDFRVKANGISLPEKLKRLCRMAGISSIFSAFGQSFKAGLASSSRPFSGFKPEYPLEGNS